MAGSAWEKKLFIAVFASLSFLVFLRSAGAQSVEMSGTTNESGRIEATADTLEYDRESGWIEGRGNVVVRKGDAELRANHVRVNAKTEEAYAFGNVTLKRSVGVWTGNKLEYNFKTQTGNIGKFAWDSEPFHVKAKTTTREKDNVYVLSQSAVTTCTNKFDHPHYFFRAKKVSMVPDDHITARHAVFHMGPVPVFYLPYWRRDLDRDTGFRFYPGYNSRMGAFLLSSYRHKINPALSEETHLDYRTERGVAVGQDFMWQDPDGRWKGDITTYYLDDQKPIDDDEDPATSDIDSDRYRIRLRQRNSITDRDYLMLQAQYVSDTDVREDFFEDEYRESVQPENYLTYTHRGDKYSANALFQTRLNDFYANVNRMPELSVDFLRQQLGESDFYYEGRTAAANLERVWPEEEGEDPAYSAFRIDSSHTFYRPSKHYGFLNLIPRAGYRGTYYSKTRESITTVETVTRDETNSVVNASGITNLTVSSVTEPVETVTEYERTADLRSLVEFGMEASFKAFKTWDHPLHPKRHIVEPYANYTYIPEPSLLEEDLYQFDEVDRLGKQHLAKIGVRNKLQTKKKGQAFDLIDLDMYTYANIERDDGQDFIGNFYFDCELRPTDGVAIDLDGIYDPNESELSRFNTQIDLFPPSELWHASVEHRFINERSNLLLTDLTFFPEMRWSFNVYGRYEFEDSRLEEQGGYIQRTYDCMAIRTGVNMMPGYTRSDGSEVEDEWRVAVAIWLTAFPEFGIATGRHRN